MFSIGDIAKLGRVSVRMLRHYDAIGLLTPAVVDTASGYRFYNAEQLRRLNRVIALKDLGFTLQQVQAILDDQVDVVELRCCIPMGGTTCTYTAGYARTSPASSTVTDRLGGLAIRWVARRSRARGGSLSTRVRFWRMERENWTVEDHLRGKPPGSLELYQRFVELVEACGPFTYAVAKTAITFKGSRRGFAGARPTMHGLAGYLDLERMVEDPRISSAAPYTKRLFVHQFRITAREQLDDEFAGWVREAYDVGQGGHLAGSPDS